jgi:hypothetical protein
MGIKSVPVLLVSPHSTKKLQFAIDVPGIKQDYKMSDFENRYRPEERVLCSAGELEKRVEVLPCCTTNKKGTKNGDPLNLMIVGDLKDLLMAFKLAGWDETEVLSPSTAFKMARAFLNGEDYRYAPVSDLYFEGRRQDIAFQKTRDNIEERLHLRLWYSPFSYDKKPVWIGQVSRDVGVRLTKTTWNLMTHQIDPDVDESREYVMADLVAAQRVKLFGYIKGVGEVPEERPRKNLTGNPYYTDGMRLAMEISPEDTEPFFTDWALVLSQGKQGEKIAVEDPKI